MIFRDYFTSTWLKTGSSRNSDMLMSSALQILKSVVMLMLGVDLVLNILQILCPLTPGISLNSFFIRPRSFNNPLNLTATASVILIIRSYFLY